MASRAPKELDNMAKRLADKKVCPSRPGAQRGHRYDVPPQVGRDFHLPFPPVEHQITRHQPINLPEQQSHQSIQSTIRNTTKQQLITRCASWH